MEDGRILPGDDEFVIGPAFVSALAAAAVRQQARTHGAAIAGKQAGDAQPQEHPLYRLDHRCVALRQSNAGALALRALYGAIRVEQPAQKSPVEVARATFDGRCHGLVAVAHVQGFGETGKRRELEKAIGTATAGSPSGEIAAMRRTE